MYLKSIEVNGFKSFANKTRFEFHNGITCIVGPNGSGKSNVADAVRWVFGEQSARSIRAGNMQDVIFAGTQLRKPLSFAEVSLTLDNSDKTLASDEDEVRVTRKVYRSGESEYLINNTNCRLKDVMELFYDTGIGKEGYSIIGQGQVDKILSSRMEERRDLFDEACGIVKFKKRKAVALKKLESEHQSMLRLTDILSELEKQVGPLKKQSEAARKYLTLRDELKSYDINAFLLDEKTLSDALHKNDESLNLAKKNLSEEEQKETELKDKFNDVESKMHELDAKIEQVRALLHAKEKEMADRENECKLIEERISSEEKNKALHLQHIKELKERIASVEEKIAKNKEEKASIEGTLSSDSSEIAKKEEEITKKEAEISLYQKTIDEEHGKTIDFLTERSGVEGRLQSLTAKLSEEESYLSELNKNIIALREKLDALKEDLEKKTAEEKAATEKLEKAQESLLLLRGNLEKAGKEYADAQRTYLDLQQEIQVKNGRLESLKSIIDRYEGFQPAVREIMNNQKDSEVYGTVSDLIHVDPKYRTLIETALGGNFQNIIVETEAKAKALVEHLRNEKAGRATFLPLDSIRPSGIPDSEKVLQEPGVIGTSDTLISCDAKFKKAVQYLLERFIAVDTIENALKIARKYNYTFRFVTLTGEFLNVGGALSGGAFKNSSGVLGRNEEVLTLQKEIQEAKAALDSVKETVNLKKQLRDSLSVEENDSQDSIRDLQILMAQTKAEKDSVLREQSALKLQEEETGSKMHEIEESMQKVSGEKEGLLSAMEKLETSRSGSGDSYDSTKTVIKESEEALAVLRKEVSDLRLNLSNKEQRILYLKESDEDFKAETEKALEDIHSAEKLIEIAESNIAESKAELAEKKENIQADGDSKGLEDAFKKLSEEKETLSVSQKEYFDKRDAISDTINGLNKEIVRLEANSEKCEERLSALTEYIWTEYSLTPTEAEEFRDKNLIDDTPAQIRKHANELKSEIKSLGVVNVNAIEQYAEVSERYEFMTKQYKDVKEAEDNLVTFVKELDEGMRTQFREEFTKIQAEFNVVFQDLFTGGVGKLEIPEGADPIDSDISIIAQPPGKKLSNMMQLSGGEKALTAIALIFAIQHLKPSPFCLLDEIEAALDDTNVSRFTNYIKRLIDKTQYIMITHRRGTMVAADRLYGITMQEKGVSTLVSVDLVEQDLDN